jgi:hypothetical protein
MKTFCKLAVMSGVMFLSFAMPAMAQTTVAVDFTTSFPFYAGNAKLPAGTYTITQPQADDNSMLLIQSKNGSYSTFLESVATQASTPHAHSDVTFKKYGTTDYLSQVWVANQINGLEVVPTKVEQKAAAGASPVQHSVPGKAK